MIVSKDDELSIEIQDKPNSPYKNLMLERIMDMNILETGRRIRKHQVEEIVDCKFIDETDWVFRGKYYQLKEVLESKGYFITQSGLDIPEFRILETNEMAEHGLKKLCKATKNIFKVHYVLKTHNHSILEGRDRKIYDHILNKSAMLATAHQKMLLKNEHFNSKEMGNSLREVR